jgi:hypothetical protein
VTFVGLKEARSKRGRKVKINEENKQRRKRMSTNTRRGRSKREDLKTIKEVYRARICKLLRAQESIPRQPV